jgi:hypothetical protein
VVDKANSLHIEKNKVNRASILLISWLKLNRAYGRKGFSGKGIADEGEQGKRTSVDMIFENLESLVSSKRMYRTAKKLIASSEHSATSGLEQDLAELAQYHDILPRLRGQVARIFGQIVDAAVERNRRLPASQRLRYTNVCNVLRRLKPYTTRHHKGTYSLLKKVMEKDTLNTMSKIYESLGNLPHDLPDNIIRIIDKVLESLPAKSATDEYEFSKIDQFIITVSRAGPYHKPCELETFFELESSMFEAKGPELHENLEHIMEILDRSSGERCAQRLCGCSEEEVEEVSGPDGEGDAFPDDVRLEVILTEPDSGADLAEKLFDDSISKLVSRYGEELQNAVDKFRDDPAIYDKVLMRFIRRYIAEKKKQDKRQSLPSDPKVLDDGSSASLGYRYLQFSDGILRYTRKTSFSDAVKDFAVNVRSLHNSGRGEQDVVEFMRLFQRTASPDGASLGSGDEMRFRELLCSASMHETLRIVYSGTGRRSIREYAELIEDEDLKAHLREAFGQEVTHIHNLTKDNFLLYVGRQPQEEVEAISRRGIDPILISRAVQYARQHHMLEKKFNLCALGCGPALPEIAYHQELVKMKYRPYLDLYDKSLEYLKMARYNCFKSGIPPPLVHLRDIWSLDETDLAINRQVAVMLIGGTLFNWDNWLDFVMKVGYNFDHRDRLTPDGDYALQRYNPNQKRRPDIFMVGADVQKDEEIYRSLEDQYFLANGLTTGFYIPKKALMSGDEYMHTTYNDPEANVLRCIFLLTEKVDKYFQKGQAIRVIDSGIMDEDGFPKQMSKLGWRTYIVRGHTAKALALCWRKDSEEQKTRRRSARSYSTSRSKYRK